MRYATLTIFWLLFAATSLFGQISDMGMARDWCDNAMLRGPEGIWEFPDDDTRVLVRRAPGMEKSYDIIVIESPDTRLVPGETIGSLKETASSSKFEMWLYRNKQKGILGNPGKCLAELNSKDDAMLISARKLKFSLSARWLLPSFWKAMKVSVKDPLEKLPYGMTRIYPQTVRRHPDYL